MAFSGTVTSDFLKYIPGSIVSRENNINYAAGDFSTFRDALISYAKAVFPLDYNNFSESDFGTFLIELMSAVGHIQSIKADYLANENYLRTARSLSSVKKLLELIGVRMKGPISAAGNAKITFNVAEGDVVESVIIHPENRTFTITSPEDGGELTFTIYKVKNDGTVNLDALTTSLVFQASANPQGVVSIEDAVILEGALIVETGTFQSPETVKSIELSQFPYVEKSAQIYVEGSSETEGVYSEEENLFYSSGSSDKIFEIATDSSYRASVIFGDSNISISPNVGDTYTVSYRVGGGSRGNLSEGVINVPITVIAVDDIGTETEQSAIIQNTSMTTGGADAESVAHAKRYAPLIFKRQDRLVTLADYKSFVNTFISNYGSTGKANAVVRRAFSSANIIDLFVLEKASNTQLRKATPAYKAQLLEAIQEKKMLTDEPVVVDGLIRTLDLFLNVTLDKIYRKKEQTVRGKIKEKILDYFNLDNNDFGKDFIPQDLIKYLLQVEEVTFATIDNVTSPIKINFNEIIQLNNLTINTTYI